MEADDGPARRRICPVALKTLRIMPPKIGTSALDTPRGAANLDSWAVPLIGPCPVLVAQRQRGSNQNLPSSHFSEVH